ncbi:hypothetical protein FCR2A7T_24760 [Flavobacterium cauense R2A-7]|uniref:Uncharacterized protein n=1 Tax=Flavobacterium cauense R2A-7 TaxID=1341154 RepID=V6RY22_9FLAO|nr:hypothetical protein [Flavobacterium cauense]ESU19059.1 hypothetical protein FCR2A7T_24760 [Flavobacterium cauense R2A-7]KGO82312.1 hypothetical protein Q762_06435 [Flavobacterium cauense R2A-7]TWI15275.1 hypothetical protein IP98_00267 [Flavobacterium cauense R2A-7]
MQKIYDKTNFHKHTFCIYREVTLTEINGLKLSYTSKSGSSYYFTEKGLYRVSNHWGRAANCRWRLLPIENGTTSKTKAGYADWTDFYPNNEHENLFYVEVNWETNEVSFQHKNNPEYNGKAHLRNATETAKVIRHLNEVLTTDNWAKYINFEDIIALRKEAVTMLTDTNSSFLEIKRKLTAAYGTA